TGDVDVHATDGVDDRLEPDEVDGHVVVDLDAEVLLDGVDQALGAGLRPVEGGVHPVGGSGPGDGQVQVPGDGEDRRLPALVVGVEDHDRVAALALHQARAGLLA